VAEVALEGVAVDDDPVFETVADRPVAKVLAVGPVLHAKVGNDHGNPLEQPLKLLRQGIDRVGDELFELAHRCVFRHRANGRVIATENPPRGES
jgi:hypothetical protein